MSDEWIEIFKGGSQTSSDGVVHNGDWLIEQAVKKFDPAKHEPPECIGHPKDNHPAYGWISGLKVGERNGVKVLLAKSKDRTPDFQDWLEKKHYKKRSAAFYKDGSLCHVAYLGAKAPAVKGLKDMEFEHDDSVRVFEFEETPLDKGKTGFIETPKGGGSMTLEAETTDTVGQSQDAGTNKQQDEVVTYSEADMKNAEEKARANAIAEFAEAQRKKDNATYVADKVKAGIIPAALVNSGLVAFMDSLDSASTITFADGHDKSQHQWFMSFMDSIVSNPMFKEFATKEESDDPIDPKFVEAEKAGNAMAAYLSEDYHGAING